jgi:hypothetical protein
MGITLTDNLQAPAQRLMNVIYADAAPREASCFPLGRVSTGRLTRVSLSDEQSLKESLHQVDRNAEKIGYYVVCAGSEQNWNYTVGGDTNAALNPAAKSTPRSSWRDANPRSPTPPLA